jgi:hypothetical protein
MSLVPSPVVARLHQSRLAIYARWSAAIAASVAVGVAGYHTGGVLVLPSQASAAEQDVDYFFGLMDGNDQEQIGSDWLAFDDAEVSS